MALDGLFHQLPTEKELSVLLHRVELDNAKLIAHKLNLSVRAIESHLANLKAKLNQPLQTVLSTLRQSEVTSLKTTQD